jgi:YihY family inner membrane protein
MQAGAEVERRVTRSVARGRGAGDTARGAVERFREADGTSHSRALAYQAVFVVISGFIGLVGLASVLGVAALRRTVVEMATQLAPGPSARLLEEAVRSGSSGAGTAMVLGLGSALVAGVFAMAQFERSGNRIAGRRDDRDTARRWLVATGLALSAGVAIAVALVVIGGGQAIATGAGWEGGAETAWSILRWPLGFALATAGIYVLFRAAPAVRLAGTRGLVVGSLVAVALWLLFTLGLSLYFSSGGSQREAYGSMLAVVALIVWAGATSLAVHLGMAVAAEMGSTGRSAVSVPDAGTSRRS